MKITISISRILEDLDVLTIGKRIIAGLFPGKVPTPVNSKFEQVSVKGSFQSVGHTLLVSGWRQIKTDHERKFDIISECWRNKDYPNILLEVVEDKDAINRMIVSITSTTNVAYGEVA